MELGDFCDEPFRDFDNLYPALELRRWQHMKFRNISGSSFDQRVSPWISLHESVLMKVNCSVRLRRSLVLHCAGCSESRRCHGGHVWINDDKTKHFIVPLCPKCNNPNNTDEMTCQEDVLVIEISPLHLDLAGLYTKAMNEFRQNRRLTSLKEAKEVFEEEYKEDQDRARDEPTADNEGSNEVPKAANDNGEAAHSHCINQARLDIISSNPKCDAVKIIFGQ